MRRRVGLSLALAAAVAVLAGSVALTVGNQRAPWASGPATMMNGAAGMGGAGMMGAVPGSGMMGGPGVRGGAGMMNGTAGMMGTVWLAGDGRTVTSIPAARARAASAASPQRLHPGEIIWFANGFYVELKDTTGQPATEVIVDPATGTVSTEPGPAMMWNTRYGMHRTATGAATVSAAQARRLATTWLSDNLPGRRLGEPDAYPGYYTMETTTAAGTINGMLSVNATTGAVWYHTWHDRFIAREDA